jgi:hypothetical protein
MVPRYLGTYITMLGPSRESGFCLMTSRSSAKKRDSQQSSETREFRNRIMQKKTQYYDIPDKSNHSTRANLRSLHHDFHQTPSEVKIDNSGMFMTHLGRLVSQYDFIMHDLLHVVRSANDKGLWLNVKI